VIVSWIYIFIIALLITLQIHKLVFFEIFRCDHTEECCW